MKGIISKAAAPAHGRRMESAGPCPSPVMAGEDVVAVADEPPQTAFPQIAVGDDPEPFIAGHSMETVIMLQGAMIYSFGPEDFLRFRWYARRCIPDGITSRMMPSQTWQSSINARPLACRRLDSFIRLRVPRKISRGFPPWRFSESSAMYPTVLDGGLPRWGHIDWSGRRPECVLSHCLEFAAP